jgi:STAS domain
VAAPGAARWCAICKIYLPGTELQLESGDGRLLRIIESEADGTTTVHLEGRLFSAWVDEVRSVIARRAAAGPVRLDLTELRYADAAGIELLKAFEAQGIEITSSSPYSSALL